MTELMERKAFVTRWRKMLKLQAKLDERIVKGNGLTYKDLHKAMEYLRMELEDQANEVYEAYKKKNAVNRQRIEEGY